MEDEGKKEDLFGFTPEGERIGYISLEQARVVAMRTARDNPGNYGRRFSGVRMVFDVAEQQEGEDYYVITLSFRPEGDFEGTPGREEVFIEKEGAVAHRQVRGLPKGAGERRFPVVPVAVGLVIVAVVAVAGAVFAMRGGDGDVQEPTPAPRATSQPTQAAPSEAPTDTPEPTARPTATTFAPPAAAPVAGVTKAAPVAGITRTAPAAEAATPAPAARVAGPFLTAETTNASPGERVGVRFSGAPGGQDDWIGIFLVGAPNTNPAGWTYLEGNTQGTVTFDAPGSPGTYEYRMFPNDSDTDIAISQRLQVELLIDGLPPREFVVDFLNEAIWAEMLSYERLDPSYAARFYAGETLLVIEESVDYLSEQGWYLQANHEWESWYQADVRVISEGVLEVDDCETWSNSYYNLDTGALVASDAALLVPSTFTIERLGTQWFLTDIVFHDPPHFCSEPAAPFSGPTPTPPPWPTATPEPTPTFPAPPTPTPAPTPTPVPPTLIAGMVPSEFAASFLSAAYAAEILTWRYLDPTPSASFEAGEAMSHVEELVADLSGLGWYLVAELDWAAWNLLDVRLIDDAHLEADSCEMWTNNYYSLQSDNLVRSDAPLLTPQTVTIERLGTDWRITRYTFYDPPHFCR